MIHAKGIRYFNGAGDGTKNEEISMYLMIAASFVFI